MGGKIEAALANLPELLTVGEVAAVLRLTPKGVYSMIEARRIPSVRVSNRVRVLRVDLVDWLRENRVSSSEK